MAFSLSGSTITQSGTDADLTGLSAIAGVTTLLDANTGGHVVRTCDIGGLQLVVTGTLSIPARHWLKANSTGSGNSIQVDSGGVLIIDGRRTIVRNGVSKVVNPEACGILLRRPSGTPFQVNTFLCNGRLEQYGGIFETAGTFRFNSSSRIVCRDAIWQMFDRGGFGYMNCYIDTDDLDIDGLTFMGNTSASPGFFKNPKAGGQLRRYKAVDVEHAFSPIDGMSGDVVTNGTEFGFARSDFNVRFGGTTTVDLGTRAPGASPVGGYDFIDAIGSPYTILESSGGVNNQTTGAARQWITYTPAFLDSVAKTILASGVMYLKDSNNGNRKTTNGAAADVVKIVSMAAGLIAPQQILTTVWSFPGNISPPCTRDNRLPVAGGMWSYSHTFTSVAVTAADPSQAPTLYAVADTNVTLSESAARAKLASSFTVNTTTKVVTVTATSELTDLYDAIKAYKATAAAVNLTTPTLESLIVSADGRNLTGHQGWTLVVNAGVSLYGSQKFNFLYFDTIINNGGIGVTHGDSTGTRVKIATRNGDALSTYVTINGTPVGGTVVDGALREGWVPLTVDRTITVRPSDIVRIAASYYGSKPQVFNLSGTQLDQFTLTLDVEPAIEVIPTAIRNAIAASFSSVTNGQTIEVTINRTLAQYTPTQVISGLAYYLTSKGYLIFGAIAQSNNAALYEIKTGTIISRSAAYKIRMADLDANGEPIVPSEQGYEVPVVVYYEDPADGTKGKMTLLNQYGSFLSTAPWPQSQSSVGDSDQDAIATKTRLQIEASTIVAKEATAASRLASSAYTPPDNEGIALIKAKTDTLVNGPTLAQIEGSSVLAKEATVASRGSQASIDAIPKVGDIVSANIVKVNNVAVDGTGVDGDEWGPVGSAT